MYYTFGCELVRIEGCTSAYRPKNKIWKDKWELQTDSPWPNKCCARRCSNEATVGANISIEGVDGSFILPICKPCNSSRSEWFRVITGSKAVKEKE